MAKPTYDSESDSNAAGKLVLGRLMHGNFVLREYNPDTFIDYEAEERTGGEPQGKTIYIQLKSQKVLRGSEKLGKVQFPRKHLKYYLEKREHPVFAVLVDVASEMAYYLFMQRWLKEQSLDLSDLSKKTTISIPLENDLRNIPKFKADCEAARLYMRELYPSSPEAALAHLKGQYSALDPRFEIEPSVTSLGRHFKISAKTPVNVQIEVTDGLTPKLAQQFADTLAFGVPFRAENLTLEASGSPLFEKMMNGQPAAIFEWTSAATADCAIELSSDSKEQTYCFQLPATVSFGLTGLAFSVNTGTPLAFSGTAPVSGSVPKSGKVKFKLDLALWHGKKVRDLPWFEPLSEFVKATAAGAGVRFALVVNGTKRHVGTLPAIWKPEEGRGLSWWFDMVVRMREISLALDINPILPELNKITDGELRNITRASELLRTGKKETAGLTFSFARGRSDKAWTNLESEIRKAGESVGYVRATMPHLFVFLGNEQSFGTLEAIDEHVRFKVAKGSSLDGSSENILVDITRVDGRDMTLHLNRSPEYEDGNE